MILIIESNSVVAQSLEKALKLFSNRIVIMSTFKNSLDIICNHKTDYIIATEEILNEYGQSDNIHSHLIKSGIPIVLLTALGLSNTCHNLNIIGTHYKPFDPNDVYENLVSYAKEVKFEAVR